MSEPEVFERIRDEIGKNDVLLFMKGTSFLPISLRMRSNTSGSLMSVSWRDPCGAPGRAQTCSKYRVVRAFAPWWSI